MSPYYMKPNARSRAPTCHVFVDTESQHCPYPNQPQAELHTLQLGYATRVRLEGGKVRSRQYCTYYRPEHFWEWLLPWIPQRRQVWLWGHRVAWDFCCLDGWKYLVDAGYRCERPVLEDPPTIIHWIQGEKKVERHIVIIDSMNWWRTSLEHIGDSVGHPKLLFPQGDADETNLLEYCIRDAEILETAVLHLLSWCRAHDLGVVQKTAPAQALQCYRHRFGPRRDTAHIMADGTEKRGQVVLPCLHGQKVVTQLERDSYYGGQCEVYYLGHIDAVRGHDDGGQDIGGGPDDKDTAGRIYHLDSTSFYPSVMRGRRYPCRLKDYWTGPDVRLVTDLLDTECVIADVILRTAKHTFPRRVDGKLSYPVGIYQTTLAGPELTMALRHKLVVSVGRIARYEGAELFTSYVDYFWGLRHDRIQAGDAAGAELCKLMLNGLYGKFGQRTQQWQDCPGEEKDLEWGFRPVWDNIVKKQLLYRGVAGTVQLMVDEVESSCSFPAIPAYVTSYGRERMRYLRDVCGPRRVYYTDTDSLHVSELGYVLLEAAGEIHEHTLGKLRVVAIAESAEYRGLKDYTFGDTVVIAGVRDPQHNRCVDGYHVRASQRLSDVISRQPLPGIIVKNLTVKRHNDQLTGRVGPDGWVLPVTAGPDQQCPGQASGPIIAVPGSDGWLPGIP